MLDLNVDGFVLWILSHLEVGRKHSLFLPSINREKDNLWHDYGLVIVRQSRFSIGDHVDMIV